MTLTKIICFHDVLDLIQRTKKFEAEWFFLHSVVRREMTDPDVSLDSFVPDVWLNIIKDAFWIDRGEQGNTRKKLDSVHYPFCLNNLKQR